MLTTSDKGMNVIKSFEGVSLRAYRDSVGVWTIGYGLTNYDVGLPWKIAAGLTITMADAELWLPKSLQDHYEPAVREAMKDPTQPQFDAGGSFHYNTGAIKRASWVGALNRKDMDATRTGILAWDHAGGKVLAGLTRRRRREWAMIQTGDYGPEGVDHHPQVITRNEDTGSSTGTPVTRPGPGMLGLHDTGPEVKEAQGWLVQLKLLPSGSDSGTFDEATEKAVMAFQASHPQLTKDGVIGPATRSALQRDIKAQGATKTAGKIAGGTIVSGGVAWKLIGAKLAIGVGVVGGVLVLGAAAYLAYKHRDELEARFNRLVGRTTP